jgi:hypothetical protein
LGAAQGLSTPGIVAACAYVSAQLVLYRGSGGLWHPILASGALGLVAESMLAASGLVQFAAHWPHGSAAPAWIVALWLAFGATLPATARLLGSDAYGKAAALGAVFGPLAYAAGAKIGALAIKEPSWAAFAAIGGIWALSMPLLLAIARRS